MTIRTHASKLLLASVTASALFMVPIGDAGSADAASASTIVSQAGKLKGVKYSYGGTTTHGFDCSGFVQYVFQQAGMSIPRTTGAMYSRGTSVSKSSLRAGDLVFFNTSGSGVSHVGIFIGNGQFIHSSSSNGVSVSSVNDKYYWGKRYVGAKRINGVN